MHAFVNQKKAIPVRRKAIERLEKCERECLCVACLEPIVAEEKTMRGMHMRCYFATKRAIDSGKTTEEERLQEGKMLEAKPGGRKPSNPVSLDCNQ